MDEHVAAADVAVVFQAERDGHRREGVRQVAVARDDARDAAAQAGGKDGHLVADARDAADDLAGVAAEVRVGPQDVLHRESKVNQVLVAGDERPFRGG